MRQLLSGLVVASWVMFSSLPAHAADGSAGAGNRDGAASAGTGAAAGAGAGASAGTAAGASAAGEAGAATTGTEQPSGGPLPALPSAAPANYDAPPMPPPLRPRRKMKWGAEFRLEGAPMGSDAAPNAGMVGFGLSLRPRPSPAFAIDIGVDFFGGRDFNGERRGEQSLTIDPMIFINGRGKVSPYFFGGLGIASARVEHPNGSLSRYSYVGVNGGVGLEFRFWQRIAIDTDVLFFVRDHTDDDVIRAPEFVDPVSRRYTNTSKGAIFRAGLAYYW